jgi:hypothetical protein
MPPRRPKTFGVTRDFGFCLLRNFQRRLVGREAFEFAPPRDRRDYQINFRATCNCRLAAAVLLMVLNSPNVGVLDDA